MSRGNTRRARRANNQISKSNLNVQQEYDSQSPRVRIVLDEIQSHWKSMPPHSQPFLLKERDTLTLYELFRFWSYPEMIENTRGGGASIIAAISRRLARLYLAVDMLPEAKALTLNGSFFHQCCETAIETIAEKMHGDSDPNSDVFSQGLTIAEIMYGRADLNEECFPLFSQGENAIQTPQLMKKFLLHQKSPPEASRGAQIRLRLVDYSSFDSGFNFTIRKDTTLKALFKDYAVKRGVSLRSLRFSHHGEVLFLSNAGNQTPYDLNMSDQDIINVADTSPPTHESISNMNTVSTSKRAKFKRPKMNGKPQKRVHMPLEEPERSLEEYKAQHSKMLTDLHEELEPRLKELRNRLNALGLERKPPKKKQKNKRKNKAKENTDENILTNLWTGGKAGKPIFTIQVGAVENLYKTKKSHYLQQPGNVAMIDLHGYTKNEALKTLNEKLPEWVDTAMKGEYPWVVPVQIVCGCGNQVLSEALQEWIKSTKCVRNSSRNFI